MSSVMSGFLGNALTGLFQHFTGLYAGGSGSASASSSSAGTSDDDQDNNSTSGQHGNDNNNTVAPIIPFQCGSGNQQGNHNIAGVSVSGNNNNIHGRAIHPTTTMGTGQTSGPSLARRFLDDKNSIHNDNRQSISNDYESNKTNQYIINNNCVINIVSTVTLNGPIQTITAQPGTPVSVVATVRPTAFPQSPCVQMCTILNTAKNGQSSIRASHFGDQCQNLTSVWNGVQDGMKTKHRIPPPKCSTMIDIFTAFMKNVPSHATDPDPSCANLEEVWTAFEKGTASDGKAKRHVEDAAATQVVKVVTAVQKRWATGHGDHDVKHQLKGRNAYVATAPAGSTGYITLGPASSPTATSVKSGASRVAPYQAFAAALMSTIGFVALLG
ncbi:hypothetical protein KVT40_003677 [Elsinoe batatas]|uniref:Uncharacterized protein n=1 Tax=Elsinoe batatas TaxID=2601811 RepID=A0A8K0L3I2_9PEZI|nr:hypothetical protein KVT40_003677 [Elsinoe batatas]